MSTNDRPMLALARDASQFIDGAFCNGQGEAFAVTNPSTETTVVEITSASQRQVEDAIASARKAADPWAAVPVKDRVALLRRYVAELQRDAQELTDVLIAEAGCVAGSSPMARVVMNGQVAVPLRQAGEILDLFLTLPPTKDIAVPLADRINALGKQVNSIYCYVPVGVVSAIAAYNFPFFTAMWKVFPALVAGNSVILRPSPLTPVSALVFGKAAVRAGLPQGVVNVVLEGGIGGGQLMTTHPHVDMVTFTGSSSVGRQVMAQAAGGMKRVQLELGGKSAQIFLADAVNQANGAAAGVCLAHAGQGCVLGTRIFVPQEHKQSVLDGMKNSLASVVIGDAADSNTQLGPLISAAQVARCEHFVAAAVGAGAKVVTGGKRPSHLKRGFFFEPTVLDTPDNQNPAAREEIFGPVVSVIGYRDVDHAVAMANDSDYGLSGYVYGGDKAKCLEIASRLKTGTVNVNGTFSSSYVSGGGHRLSGMGRERGEDGLRLYQQITCLNLCA